MNYSSLYVTAFESSVVLEGSKTLDARQNAAAQFESSVVLEGSKTGNGGAGGSGTFENSAF